MRRAFTLIEILIAIAILAIVISSSAAIFRSSAVSWQKGQIRAERYQKARFILERMSREISSVLPVSLAGPHCLGSGEKFCFVFTSPNAPASLIETGYWLEEETQELKQGLQSPPDYDFDTFDNEEVLSEEVCSLVFSYFTAQKWQDRWNSLPQAAESGHLPQAVKITFGIRDRKSGNTEVFESIVGVPAAVD